MNNDPLVCVVDDEEGIRSLIGQALEGEDYRVATYPDGESFLDAADTDPPDLVFLDINMPGMNGWEVQETMAKRGDLDPTVIAVTARGGRSVRKSAEEGLGFDDYLRKPFDLAEILDAASTALGDG
jgi:CheY-like chemotaxis protein